MPRDKDLKRLVRSRMTKTGEAYTAARAQILRKPSRSRKAPAAPRAAVSPDASRFAELAGMSDATIKERTGCTWERWVYALDRLGAGTMSHRDIAELVSKKYKVSGWWSQTVTVGYERIKGLRARGQRRDGTYEANKSRTFAVPVETLYDAWASAASRGQWLAEPQITLRTKSAAKYVRFGWRDGQVVVVGFTPKGAGRSAVAVQHTKVADRETADRLKQYWEERLDALAEYLASRGGTADAQGAGRQRGR